MIGEQVQVNSDGTLTVTCKIPGNWYPLLNVICEMKGTNINNLLKMCLQFLIETSKVTTEASADMKVLLHMMRIDSNWQEMFKYCDKAKLDIAQVILILQQSKDGKPRDGFGLAMFNKPYCGDCQQTLCVDEIVERVLEVAMGFSDYWDMRKIAQHFDAKTIREALVRMVDCQAIVELDEADRQELPGMGDVTSNGKPQTFEVRTKRKQHRTPDSVADDHRFQQTHIIFGDDDREVADYEAEGWEGEHRQTEEPPEDMSDHD
jgi:hypothetical protein